MKMLLAVNEQDYPRATRNGGKKEKLSFYALMTCKKNNLIIILQ